MGSQSQAHDNKVKITFECSLDEKTYIKMLAAKAHMTLSEFVLSYLRPSFPTKKRKTNKETLAAHKEALEGKGETFDSLDDFWDSLGVKPNA